MKQLIPSLIIVFILFSCANSNEDNLSIIDLSEGLEKPIEIKLSQIADDLECIFLETSESCLIGNIRDIHITDNHILIIDRSLFKAMLFSRQGKFLTNIGTRGSGPGEYTQILDCCFSSSEQEIIMLCNPKRNTQIYNLSGDLISTLPTECHPNGISYFDNRIIYHIGYPNSVAYNDGYSLVVADDDFKETRLLYRERELPSIPVFLQLFNLTLADDHLSIWEAYYDTIYYMKKSHEVIPKFAFKHSEDYIFANGLVPMDEYNKRLASGYGILNLMDCDNYIFLGLSIKRKFENTIYDKASNFLYHIDNRYIINDIAGPRHFWPNSIAKNNLLCSYYHISDLKKSRRINSSLTNIDSQKDEQFEKQLELADEYDNQCIIIAKLKKNHSIGK